MIKRTTNKQMTLSNNQIALPNDSPLRAELKDSKENPAAAETRAKVADQASGALEFLRRWKNIPKDMRERKVYKPLYLEIVRQYPELKLPGTQRINYEIRYYGLECVMLAPKLSEMMSLKLKRKYSSDTFPLSMAGILRHLYKHGMSTRSEIISGAGVSVATLSRAIKMLMALGLATALKRGRDCCQYVITEAGRDVVEGVKV